MIPLDVLPCAAVSTNLEDSLASSAKATLEAIGAQEAALQAIVRHTTKLKVAMEAEVQTAATASGFKWIPQILNQIESTYVESFCSKPADIDTLRTCL